MKVLGILADGLVGGKRFTPTRFTAGLVEKEQRHLEENGVFSFITKSDIFLDFKNYILHVNLSEFFSISNEAISFQKLILRSYFFSPYLPLFFYPVGK